ncbi:electron transfer flavoprotein subunit alpha [Amycolatopsis antarctica]|uniref:Electron transfer flavoprotein subunit alpha n=1 Tax=Amycolatopsis antarctica TaxID=1854586 RepID=A0A263CZX7_9PSEU|nr:mycofactocin-associated electron transfer flavoprotein alpha subunit [Amycolatopsis antarctica]OZM71661.1 electron transfer flavoprotein subunit alpha [Amycolatopsis antarctica]
MIAVVPVRSGVLPHGAEETATEAGGRALVIGSGTATAAAELASATRIWLAEAGDYAPGRWASGIATLAAGPLAEEEGPWLLPASPDGRDLAPRLAHVLDLPLLAGAIEVTASGAELARWGSRVVTEIDATGPFVATLLPGSRTPEGDSARAAETTELDWTPGAERDAEVIEVLPPDPRTADLAEAPRILGAGAGLTRGAEPAGTEALALLEQVASALAASVGATRVVTDAGHATYERQIGTTGVVVDPELYVAFGVSGAAQHIGGLGAPTHVVSVNLDPSCPMTAMADLGIVTDATELLRELAARLGDTPAETDEETARAEEAAHG